MRREEFFIVYISFISTYFSICIHIKHKMCIYIEKFEESYATTINMLSNFRGKSRCS